MKNAILLAILNSATSVFAGFVVFMVLGYLAHESETPIEEVSSNPLLSSFILNKTKAANIFINCPIKQ